MPFSRSTSKRLISVRSTRGADTGGGTDTGFGVLLGGSAQSKKAETKIPHSIPDGRTIDIVVRCGQEGTIRRQDQDLTVVNASEKRAENPEQEPNWLAAVRAAQAKKALDIVILDLREITSLTDYFIICTGTNIRQNQAISDEIHLRMKAAGELPLSIEGYDSAEWVLMDYGDFIFHIFVEKTRSYYDLERLWRHAKRVEVPPEPIAA